MSENSRDLLGKKRFPQWHAAVTVGALREHIAAFADRLCDFFAALYQLGESLLDLGFGR